jgi:DNA-binding NarL/FixJ family response regulator
MPKTSPAPVLTPSEKEILRRLVQGYRDREIARDLALDPTEVTARVEAISRKLAVHDRLELAARAKRLDLSFSQ